MLPYVGSLNRGVYLHSF